MKNIIIFIVFGILSVWIAFFLLDIPTMILYYQKYIYYFLTICVFLWVITIINNIEANISCAHEKFSYSIRQLWTFIKFHNIALGLAFLLMICGFITTKPGFRVLADETNILSTSQSLYNSKEYYINMSSVVLPSNQREILIASKEKRPSLFAYFVCLIHTLTGYRPENIFILNFISGFISLFLIYYLIYLFWGKTWGIFGLIVLGIYPLFVYYSSSAGFEVFDLMCSLAFFVLLFKFILSKNALKAELLFLFIPLMAQCRYESVLAIIVAIPVLLIFLPKSEYKLLSYKFLISPFLFIPTCWLRLISFDATSWQVNDFSNAFSYKWFFINLSNSFVFFFSGKEEYGNLQIISVLGLIGFLFFVINLFNKNNSFFKALLQKYNLSLISIYIFWGSILFFYLIYSVVRFAYVWVNLTDPIISRLGIIFIPLFILMSVYFLEHCSNFFKLNKITISLFFIMLLFCLNKSPSLTKCGLANNEITNEFYVVKEFLESKYPNKQEYILIRQRPNLFTPLNYSSIGYDTYSFLDNYKRINNYYYDKLCSFYLVCQVINIKTGNLLKGYGMPKDFKPIEVVFEKKLLNDHLLRIYKCIL